MNAAITFLLWMGVAVLCVSVAAHLVVTIREKRFARRQLETAMRFWMLKG